MNLRAKFVFLVGLLCLLCLMLPGSIRADDVTFNMTFSGGTGPLYPTSGVFTYDTSTDTFSNFLVMGVNYTLDFTTSANDNNPVPIAACIGANATPQEAVFELLTACSSDPNSSPTITINTDTVDEDLGTGFIPTDIRVDGTLYLYGPVVPDNSSERIIAGTTSSTPDGQIEYVAPGDYETTNGPVSLNVAVSNWSVTNAPEPSSFLLLGTGLLALMVMGWRRNSQASGAIL